MPSTGGGGSPRVVRSVEVVEVKWVCRGRREVKNDLLCY